MMYLVHILHFKEEGRFRGLCCLMKKLSLKVWPWQLMRLKKSNRVCVLVEVGGMNTDNRGVAQFLSTCNSLTLLLVGIMSHFCVSLSQKLCWSVSLPCSSSSYWYEKRSLFLTPCKCWKDSETEFPIAAFYVISLSLKSPGSTTSFKPLQTTAAFAVPQSWLSHCRNTNTISTRDFSVPPKISKVIPTTVLQYRVLLFLVCRWLKHRLLSDLHISNHFWQRTDLKSPGSDV